MQQAVKPPKAPVYSKGSVWDGPTTMPPSGKFLPAGPECQPCPDCGGLECLCRPRFFAGQLLTEQDLNRLDDYITAKNRLHNRYLVGAGVVCGLAVTCSPCANTVAVSGGYAIDSCGNDVIVCAADTVDICKLISACTPAGNSNCAPYKDDTACRDMEQDWILAIRYQETPSRGTTALTGAAQCGCGGGCSCNTGVAKACGCGSSRPALSCCGGTATSTSPVSPQLPRRGAPPNCEPTLTCESYRYEVFRAPPTPKRATLIGGDLFARISCCLSDLLATLPSMPEKFAQETVQEHYAALSTYCCDLRLALLDFVRTHEITNCRLLHDIRIIDCPSPNQQDFLQAYDSARLALMLVMVEILLDCVCAAALPPCPEPADPRVPLASVRIRSSDCAIISICDWTPLRKTVVTNKTLGYWLGWLPVVPLIREFMSDLCCRALRLPEQLGTHGTYYAKTMQTQDPATGAQTSSLDAMQLSFKTRAYKASNPLAEAFTANLAGGQNAITAEALFQALFTPLDGTQPADRLAALPHTQILAEIARPLLDAFGPLASAITGRQSYANTDGLRGELDALKTTVAAQQAALDALRQAKP